MTGLLIQPNATRSERTDPVRPSDRTGLVDLRPIRAGLNQKQGAPSAPEPATPLDACAVPWAIIGAVVAAIMPPGTRVRQVVEIGVPAWNLWAVEGRRDHFGTHRVR